LAGEERCCVIQYGEGASCLGCGAGGLAGVVLVAVAEEDVLKN
jgi:hypothetical protein